MDSEVVPVIELLSAEQMRVLLHRAAEVVVDSLAGRRTPHAECPDAQLAEARGVFVTLRRDGALAGCIGFAEAPWSLWETLTEAARSAALEDTRFDRIPAEQLNEVEVEISVLSPSREIEIEDFEPGRHGLFLEYPGHRGLLLPQVATEFDLDRDGFLRALCAKAGLAEDVWQEDGCQLFAFEAQLAVGYLSSLREDRS